ncbi:hypothetical protein D3C73_631150 [compost metagenome]
MIHFKVEKGKESRQFRGLIFLEENQSPTLLDFQNCLKDCGFPNLQVEDADRAIFRVFEPDGTSFLIDVLEDYDKSISSRDSNAEALAKNFLKPDLNL